MASHVSQCMAKAYACGTHDMSCVNMHSTFEDYTRGFIAGLFIQTRGEEGRGMEKRKGGKEKRNGGKQRRGKKKVLVLCVLKPI